METKCRCKFKETDRTGLYIMVFIAMIAGCDASDRARENGGKIDRLADSVGPDLVAESETD